MLSVNYCNIVRVLEKPIQEGGPNYEDDKYSNLDPFAPNFKRHLILLSDLGQRHLL